MSEICGAYRSHHSPPLPPRICEPCEAHLGRPFDAPWAHFDSAQTSAESANVQLSQLLFAQVPEAEGLRTCMALPESGLTIAARLRLDNRNELQEALGLPEESVKWPDELFVLRAFQRWGEDSFARLVGDFALAIWDSKQETLYLVRDQMGVAPLYWFQCEGQLHFASGMAALRKHSLAPQAVDAEQIGKFLIVELDTSSNTFYRDIKRVQPGHFLRAKRGQVEVQRYFELQLTEPLRMGAADFADRFRELLVQATEARLRSPHSPSFLLSGGLDSSALVGIARDSDTPHITTYSGLFPDYPHIDEREWIDKILAEGKYTSHFHRMDRESPLATVAKDVVIQGQPYFAPNNYVDRAMLDRARSDGQRLLLDGLDGDTTVGHGWEFLGQLFRDKKPRRLIRSARALGNTTNRSTAWFIWTYAVQPTLMAARALLWGNRLMKVPRFIDPTFAKEIHLKELFRDKNDRLFRGMLAPFREQHLANLTSGLIGRSFELAQEQAHARGIIRRHPYFDVRLVEFCLALPPEQRLDRGMDRLIQRRAVGGLVPDAIRERISKSVWEQNTRERFAKDDQEMLRNPQRFFHLDQLRFVNAVELHGLVNSSGGQLPKTDQLMQFWLAYTIGVWLYPT